MNQKRRNKEYYLEGFSMKSNANISLTWSALSCNTTFDRLHLLISGTVESRSLPNSVSGYSRKHFPGPSRPARPLHHKQWRHKCYIKKSVREQIDSCHKQVKILHAEKIIHQQKMLFMQYLNIKLQFATIIILS